MSPPADTAVLYSAVLRPHRSAGRRGAQLAAILVSGFFAVVGGGFALAGAWPVLPFLGLEVILLYVALRINQRAGRTCEAINLTRTALTIRRVDPWGRQSSISLPPQWLQVNLLDMPGDDNRLELRTHGRSETVATFLLPHERRDLAVALRRALGRLT